MPLLLGIGIGTLLLYAARTHIKQSWYAATDEESVAHVKRARIYKGIGWVLVGVSIAIPLAVFVLWTLNPVPWG